MRPHGHPALYRPAQGLQNTRRVARMKAAGKWVEILEFRHNLLATAEALEAFARHVERFRSKGLSPLGSAVVIDPSLEGEAIIRPQLAAAYAAAGWPCAFFTHMADAEAWAAAHPLPPKAPWWRFWRR